MKITDQIKFQLKQKNTNIKKSIAVSINYLAPTLSKNNTNKILKEIILELLKDENSEVKIGIFNNLEPLLQVLTLDSLLPILTPILKDLLND